MAVLAWTILAVNEGGTSVSVKFTLGVYSSNDYTMGVRAAIDILMTLLDITQVIHITRIPRH